MKYYYSINMLCISIPIVLDCRLNRILLLQKCKIYLIL